MGTAAYNRGSKAIRTQLDLEAAARRRLPVAERCLCGASHPGLWTAGTHHGAHRCARVVILRLTPEQARRAYEKASGT